MSFLSLSSAFRTRSLAPNSFFSSRYLHSVRAPSHTTVPFVRSSIHIPSPWKRVFPRATWVSQSSNIYQLSSRTRPSNRRGSQSGGSSGDQRQSPFAFLDGIPQNYIIWGIIGTNVMVYLMWSSAHATYRAQGDPSSLKWMHQNFLSSWHNFREGRIWTPFTAMFSHQEFTHILFNMVTFYFLGQPVLSMLGTRQFLSLYLGGGAVSSFASMFWHNKVDGHDINVQGASGAVYSTSAFLACVAPTMPFYIYGFVPVPAWLVVSGVFAYETYSTWKSQSSTRDTAGHTAGILAGVGYFVLKRVGL